MFDGPSTNIFNKLFQRSVGAEQNKPPILLQTELCHAKNRTRKLTKREGNPLLVPSRVGEGDALFRPVATIRRQQEDGPPSSRCHATRKFSLLYPRVIRRGPGNGPGPFRCSVDDGKMLPSSTLTREMNTFFLVHMCHLGTSSRLSCFSPSNRPSHPHVLHEGMHRHDCINQG